MAFSGGVAHHRARDWPVTIRTRQGGPLPVVVLAPQLVAGTWRDVPVSKRNGDPARFAVLDDAKGWVGRNLPVVFANTDIAAWERAQEHYISTVLTTISY